MDVTDAVGALVRTQTLRVHYLGERFYTARAPCLLTQLHQAVHSSSGGRGGRTVAGSRIPLAADALDLWVEVASSVHGWADALGVDRRPYRAGELAGWRYTERTPGWVRRLWPWLGPAAATGRSLPLPEPPRAVHPVPAGDPDPLGDRAVPPIGRLLKVVAAQSVALGQGEVEDRIAHRAAGWGERIRVMLAGWAPDERIFPLRGVACSVCGRSTVVDDVDGERFVRPAVEVRFQTLEGMDPEDLWPERWCLACGDTGFLPYTSEAGAKG